MKKNKIVLLAIILMIIIVIVLGLIICNIVNKEKYNQKYENKIENITADNVEIEKKYLIDKEKIPYDLSNVNAEITEIEQTYICFSPEIRVRKLNGGSQYTFTVKTNMTSDGMTRDEFENYITEEEYNNLIKKKEGNTIHKTRYQFLDGDNLLAIDIFHDDLDGLAYLEVEFANEEEANEFETPNWVIKDVTEDVNYKNGHLARNGIPESFYEYIK